MKRCVVGLMVFACVGTASAHEGHGPEPVPVTANAPHRLPDGSVFLPKPSQRQLGVRTTIAEVKDLPQTQELSGRIVMDPNAGGRVQSTLSGRLEAGPKGWPVLGQRVKQGDVLAYVRPAAGALERGSQTAQAAELTAARQQAALRLARLQQIADSVPKKELETAQAELQSLTARVSAISGSLATREALLAPVSGIIAMQQGVAGQVVEPREVLFEIVEPGRFQVEALHYDARDIQEIAAAVGVLSDGSSIPLDFLGAGRVLRDQAIPLQFRPKSPAQPAGHAPVAIGQPLKVLLQLRKQLNGLAVPAAAIVKNAANQDSLWVHDQAERFVSHPVRVVAVDGATVLVLDGLKAGERVVVQGAQLLNQVR